MSEEKLVPKLRFIDESDNWNLFKLGEVLDKKGYIRGPFGSALKRGEMKKEGIPVYEQQHAIYNNRIFRYYIDNDKFQELKRFQVFPNDLIVSCSGTIGKTSLITNNDEKGIISQALLILRSNPNIINPKFLKYFLETNSGYNSLISSAGGSSQVNIAKKQIILDIPLLVPNLETQSKIISFLDLINNKIELLEEKHKYYQDFKKYLMQKLFAQELRFENYNEAIYKLSDLYSSKKGTGLSKDKLDEEGLNKCILYGELYTTYNEIIQDVKSKTNSQEGILSKVGDILIPSSTTTKGIDLVTASVILEENVLLSGDITILRSKNENIINNKFFAYYFTNNLVKDVSKLTQGSTIIHLYWKDFKKVKLALPPINEQNKCVDLFLKLDKKIDLINFQIQKMEEFKKGLLQQMFVVQLILSLLQNKKHI